MFPGGSEVSPHRDYLLLYLGSFFFGFEPSHSRGAPEIPEPLALLGVQYLTRYNVLRKFVRATRLALVCASPKTIIRVTFSS